ncbi:metal-dependent hydrolase [Halorubrum yunnanense]|uniref:Metal-dependent hydrolase n=1 Tax=Halorubrum yunnanense TaxID=1526162 RepID=A0ABD5YHD8_9EURY|nr:metal-dependent hydrolase [Halorubrum yunnanense]
MLFPTHLFVAGWIGWLSGRSRVRKRLPETPTLSVPWLVAGATLPDAVDKPLGALGVVDTYHSVGHSALLAPLAVAVAARHRHGLAVAVGWGSHLALDTLHIVVNGRAGNAVSLAWPVLKKPDPLGIPPGEFARFYVGTPSFYLEVAIWLTAILLAFRWRFGVGASRNADR